MTEVQCGLGNKTVGGVITGHQFKTYGGFLLLFWGNDTL